MPLQSTHATRTSDDLTSGKFSLKIDTRKEAESKITEAPRSGIECVDVIEAPRSGIECVDVGVVD